MSFPVLDKESYQYVSSEWVLSAAEALRTTGYLASEPTGVFDQEFAAALAEFQVAQGIFEQDHVGPLTWQALGVPDPDAAQVAADPPAQAGEPLTSQLSEDGQWAWNGTDWIAAMPPLQPGAPSTSQLSEDGQWEWNGTEWLPAGSAAQPTPVTAAEPGREVRVGRVRYIIYPDEVRSGGTLTWRARNPGALESGYGAYPGMKANNRFAIYPDEETGFEAIKKTLASKYARMTFLEMMKTYAPKEDGNDPVLYATTVAKRLGVSLDTRVGTLSANYDELAQEIKNFEGWEEGDSWRLDDPALPDAVKKAIRGDDQ